MSLRVAPQPASARGRASSLPEQVVRLRRGVWHLLRTFFFFWIARPDKLLLLVLAAVLRLSALRETTFLADQAQIYSLGLSAVGHHALPITGIRSSIGSFNMPASIYLLLPFIVLGDPFWGTLFTALVNIIAVMMLYTLTERYFGRRAALVTGFLYATAPWSVFFSRFVWQQNLLAPIVILMVWLVCMGIVEGKRGWLGWAVLLWGIALQLHPTALPLIVLIGLGVLFSWRRLRLRDWLYSALALVVLFVPTLLWEYASNFYDVHVYWAFFHQSAHYSLSVFHLIFAVLTPPLLHYFGSDTLYSRLYPAFSWVTFVLSLLYCAGVFWLLIALLEYARRLLARATGMSPIQALQTPRTTLRAYRTIRMLRREQQASTSDPTTPPTTDYQAVEADSSPAQAALSSADVKVAQVALSAEKETGIAGKIDERLLIVLLLWQVAPILTMLKPGRTIQEHYLLVILPALFLTIGIFFAWLEEKTLALLTFWQTRHFRLFPRFSLSEASKAFLVVLAVLTAGQAFSSVVLVLTLEESAYTGPLRFTYTHYGFPLGVQQDALATAYTAAQINQAQLYVATTWWQQQSLGYLASEANMHANVYDAGSCLTMPAADSAPAVVLATAPLETTNTLATMPGVTVLQTIGNPNPPSLQAVTDTPALTLYSVPAGAHLSNEVAVRVNAQAANQTHLVAYTVTKGANGAQQLILHWGVAPPNQTSKQNQLDYWYGAQPDGSGAAPANYWFMAQPLDSAGRPLAEPSISNCTTLLWGPKDDVYSWLNVESSAGGKPVASWRVWIARQTMKVARGTIAGIPVETAGIVTSLKTVLPGTTTIPAS